MRYASKPALLDAIRTSHDTLCERLQAIPRTKYRQPGVWADGWTIADLVAHLAEWQRMFLTWYHDGAAGRNPSMPAPGYKWNETPRLNRDIWLKYRSHSIDAIWQEFESGYREILAIVDQLPAKKLLEPGHFFWTRNNPLTTYLGANTNSHYRFAIGVLKRWARAESTGAAGSGPSPAAVRRSARPPRRSA